MYDLVFSVHIYRAGRSQWSFLDSGAEYLSKVWKVKQEVIIIKTDFETKTLKILGFYINPLVCQIHSFNKMAKK